MPLLWQGPPSPFSRSWYSCLCLCEVTPDVTSGDKPRAKQLIQAQPIRFLPWGIRNVWTRNSGIYSKVLNHEAGCLRDWGIIRAIFKVLWIKLYGKAGSKTSCQPWVVESSKTRDSNKRRGRERGWKREEREGREYAAWEMSVHSLLSLLTTNAMSVRLRFLIPPPTTYF